MKNQTIILKRPYLSFPANTPFRFIKNNGEIYAQHLRLKKLYIKVSPKNIKHENVCRIRKDILKMGWYVPVGRYYASGKTEYKYRWTGKGAEVFQIWYMKKWNTAESVDFEFN